MISCLQKNRIKGLFLISLFLLIPLTTYSQDYTGHFEFDGYNRTYEVYLPQNFQANMPLVVSIHGSGETVYWYKTYTVMHEVADTLGFVLVYPQGLGNSWNVDHKDPTDYDPPTDDVGFISTLVDTMKSHYNIDLSRVYCCGYSLGGMMSYRMAGECGHRFAAFASGSGSLFGLADSWEQVSPLSVMYIQGTADGFVPYNGSKYYWSTEKTLNYWVNNNQCSSIPDTFNVPDTVPEDNCTMQKITYSGCDGNAEVVFYKGINMGHSWPGSKTSFKKEGNKNMDINANVEILKFFGQYTNPYAYMAYGNFMSIYPAYMSHEGDSLEVSAMVKNPEQHPVSVYAHIRNEEQALVDSFPLFNDGFHGDGVEGDDQWGGGKRLSGLTEDIYEVNLITMDHEVETHHRLFTTGRFTTLGPVTLADDPYVEGDFSKRYRAQYFQLVLKNWDTESTVENINFRFTSDDPRVAEVGQPVVIGDMEPGEEIVSELTAFRFSEGYEPDSTVNKPVHFDVMINSNEDPFWKTSFEFEKVTGLPDDEVFHPMRMALYQNYPNPFNPRTVISCKLQDASYIDLSIFDIIGRKVATLVSEKLKAGKHQYTWDASGFSSGVYFCRLETEKGFVQSRKLVFLK